MRPNETVGMLSVYRPPLVYELNARRFLFYAILDGRIATGYADVPPRDAG